MLKNYNFFSKKKQKLGNVTEDFDLEEKIKNIKRKYKISISNDKGS
jgi:hypothetical protein